MVARLQFPVDSAEAFAELRRRFLTLPAKPKLLATRDGGIDISSPGRQSLSLLVGEESAGVLYATDVYLSPGFGAPPHHQPTEDELWYLLEGTLDARIGMQTVTLAPGSFAYIPRDTTHTFRNNGTALVRLLAWNAPGGHERAFEAMRDKAEAGITDFPSLREVLGHHGIDLHRDADEVATNDGVGGAFASKGGSRAHARARCVDAGRGHSRAARCVRKCGPIRGTGRDALRRHTFVPAGGRACARLLLYRAGRRGRDAGSPDARCRTRGVRVSSVRLRGNRGLVRG